MAWRDRAEPLPAATAVAAALADTALTEPAGRALVAVIPLLRAELQHIEDAITAPAHRAGIAADQVRALRGATSAEAS